MTLSDLGSLGEFVGSIAVVLSLLYLAFQIRQNTKSVRASTHHGMVESSNALAFRLSDADAARIILKGGRANDDLTPEEKFRFSMLMRASFGFYEEAYHQFWEGLLERDVWESRARTLSEVFDQPGVTDWWKKNRHYFSTRFRDAVDELHAT